MGSTIGVSRSLKQRWYTGEFDEFLEGNKWSAPREYTINSNYSRIRKFKITPLALRLAKKIKNDLNIDVFPVIYKLNHGHWQRSSGAWGWFMYDESMFDWGSGDRAKDVARCKHKIVVIGEREISE